MGLTRCYKTEVFLHLYIEALYFRSSLIIPLFVYRSTLLPFVPHYTVVCIYMYPTWVSPRYTLLVIIGLKEFGMIG